VSYQILLADLARRDFEQLDGSVRERVHKRIVRLADAPDGLGTKALSGGLRKYRSLRAGDWRVCYFVDGDAHAVRIVAIGHRRDIYERLKRRLQSD
jgi:mRNA interferase RelE/StbE